MAAFGCGSGSDGEAASPVQAGDRGWSALADRATAPTVVASASAFDGRELIVVGNRTKESGKWVVHNGPRAFDPEKGTWRDLPALPFEQPVVAPQLVQSASGLVLSGRLCAPDSEGFQSDDEDLVCEPGFPVVATKASNEDAFKSVALPREVGAERGRAWLFSSPSSSVTWIHVNGALLQLDEGAAISPTPMESSTVPQCAVGDMLIGTEPAVAEKEGSLPVLRVTTLGLDQEWTPLDLGVEADTVLVQCGDKSAVLAMSNQELGINQLVQLDERGKLAEVPEPPQPVATPIWDGARFIAQALGMPATGEIGSAVRPLYSLSPQGRWVVLREDETDTVEALPLDGRVALFSTTDSEGARTYEVVVVAP